MWAICKSKQAKLYIKYIYEDVKYSFSRTPLTEEQVIKCINYAPFKIKNPELTPATELKPELVFVLNKKDCPERYTKLSRRISELAKINRGSDNWETVLSKSYISKVKGTSRLVRNSDKSRIHIAKRKNNVNTKNSVCIPDDTREEFFAASKEYNGYPDDNMFCMYVENGGEFKAWSRLMDELYEQGLQK